MDLHLDSLTFHRVLGRGALGTVFLVSFSPPTESSSSSDKSSSPPPFALKVVDPCSPSSSSSSSLRRARWEISVLSRLPPHPFLPSLLAHLSHPILGLALPFCPGGDLHSLRLLQPDHLFPTSSILFYSSELLSALHHLHSHGIVYRDLKPENILIQHSGHLTLSDFDLSHYLSPQISTSLPPVSTSLHPPRRRYSLSRLFRLTHRHPKKLLGKAHSARVHDNKSAASAADQFAGRLFSFVGTEEYVSPEVVRGEGHDFMVDWWAFGVLLYEMAYGRTPFKGRNRKETFANVVSRQPDFAGGGRTLLADLIGKLLEKNPRHRLGANGGADEIKLHPFFKGVRWDMLPEVSRPPYLPPCDDELAAYGERIDMNQWLRTKREERVKSTAVDSPVPSPEPSPSASLAEF